MSLVIRTGPRRWGPGWRQPARPASTLDLIIILGIVLLFAIMVIFARPQPEPAPAPPPPRRARFTVDNDGGIDPYFPGDPVAAAMQLAPPGRMCATRDREEQLAAEFARIRRSSEVDPLITGQLYAAADNMRPVYAQRTAMSDVQGLVEYGSDQSGVGVDVGPWGLAEYGGRRAKYDDGIPAQWALPDTPVRWYEAGPGEGDFYGPQGATVDRAGLYSPFVGDHQPLEN